jgi:hypothetical protein
MHEYTYHYAIIGPVYEKLHTRNQRELGTAWSVVTQGLSVYHVNVFYEAARTLSGDGLGMTFFFSRNKLTL